MIKIQLLPFLPFIALLLVLFCNKFPKLSNVGDKISALMAILFLVTSFGLRNLSNAVSLNFLNLPSNFNFAFSFSANQMLLLLLLGVFWLVTCLSGNRYFAIIEDEGRGKFNALLLLIVGFISGIILSKNLLTILLFYQFLALTLHFTASYFSPIRSVRAAKYFGFFILATSSLLFLAAALTFKISGNIDFIQGGVFDKIAIDIWQFSLLLFLYVLAIATIAFVPLYLLFGNFYYLKPPIIILVLIGFAFPALVILLKVIMYLFGAKLFGIFINQINHHNVLTIALAVNLLPTAILAIISKNLKQILIFLLFNQIIMVVMEFLVFGLNLKQMEIVIASFVLGQLLIFIAVTNINLYLKGSEDKTLNGVLYKLRITILALIFALLNLSGLIPAIGMAEKYWLFKDVINDKAVLNGLVVLINIGLCLVCSVRMIYPMLEISSKNNNPKNYQTAKDIEWDLSLILPTLFLPALLFIMAFPFVTNFLIH